jgi:hypothetical protein
MFAQGNSSRFTALFTACCRARCLVLFAFAQLLLASGCAVVPRRPPQIPAFVPGDEKLMSCPRIAGHYTDQGEAFTVKGKGVGKVSLSQLLFGADPACAGVDSITVREPGPDVIEMQLSKQGHSVATRRFSKYAWHWNWDSSKLGRPYYGVKGFMDILTKDEHGGAAPLGGYAAGKECLLRKAVDGSLVVLQREEAMGLVVIVPFYSRKDLWCRFPPLEDGGQPQPGLVK